MNKTIGIFGGGQLGRMMAQAALPLNIQCTFFEANHNCPSAILGQVFSEHDVQGLEKFIESADVFSLEFENTPLADVDTLLPSFTTSTNTITGTSPSGEESKSFATIVAEHRDHLASSSDSKLSSFDMALISFKDKEDELGNPTLGKRKRRGRNNAIEKHLRKAQRNVLRSRNEVVDEWLDLDADNADRNDSMDAFVDLEDFLVEG